MVRNPQALVLPTQLSGDKDIWQLDPHIYLSAQNGLRPVGYKWWPPWEYNLMGSFDIYPFGWFEEVWLPDHEKDFETFSKIMDK